MKAPKRLKTKAFAAAAILTACTPAFAQSGQLINDYPTIARADYIFGCMAANGQTRDVMEKCACSIDIVANILPYDKYVEAETILRMRLIGGEKSAAFKQMAEYRAIVDDVRNAQAEAEIRCF